VLAECIEQAHARLQLDDAARAVDLERHRHAPRALALGFPAWFDNRLQDSSL
jgi:hypothetical protein